MTSIERVLRNQVRGVTGALIVAGVMGLLTVEMWWIAWERPAWQVLGYAVAGLAVVLFVARSSGFRVEEEGDGDVARYDPVRLAVDAAQLVLQSVVAALVVLWAYGIIDLSTPAHVVARMALVQVVPLGFGAALANRLLGEAEDDGSDDAESLTLRENLAAFAAGGIFFSFPLGASVEMNVLAASTDWARLGAIAALTLGATYLLLYELEFQGQSRRTVDREWSALIHAGQVCVVFAVGLSVAALLLWAFGYLTYSLAVNVQKVVVLAFPTTVGGAAARVIL
ncbi:DUF2391 family protein [Halomicrobium salinisoli]|uniref:DUF2391 family protein n=1 Tax=Halomicrobium salinisoli TaxID=2878391 RepID=UPI001CEFFC53|nr:DUF2391 family protein [Halomicrobium salinisoli]